MADEDSVEEGEEQDADESSDTVYLYRIPVENNDGVMTPVYSLNSSSRTYLHHTGPNVLTAIQEDAAGHLHRDGVNATVKELKLKDVESSDDLIGDFVQ